MDEINNNLLKLRSEVMQINEGFQKESQAKTQYMQNYMKFLNVSFIRILVLFLTIAISLYVIKPEFCYSEVIYDNTFFKEKKINETYIIGISIFLSVLIYYFTQSVMF